MVQQQATSPLPGVWKSPLDKITKIAFEKPGLFSWVGCRSVFLAMGPFLGASQALPPSENPSWEIVTLNGFLTLVYFPYLSFEFSSIIEKHYHDVLVNLCHRYHILHLLFITSTQIFNILFLSAKSRCNIIPRPSFWKRKILPPTCFLNFSMIA